MPVHYPIMCSPARAHVRQCPCYALRTGKMQLQRNRAALYSNHPPSITRGHRCVYLPIQQCSQHRQLPSLTAGQFDGQDTCCVSPGHCMKEHSSICDSDAGEVTEEIHILLTQLLCVGHVGPEEVQHQAGGGACCRPSALRGRCPRLSDSARLQVVFCSPGLRSVLHTSTSAIPRHLSRMNRQWATQVVHEMVTWVCPCRQCHMIPHTVAIRHSTPRCLSSRSTHLMQNASIAAPSTQTHSSARSRL